MAAPSFGGLREALRLGRQLTDFTTGEHIYSFAYSPDGKRVVHSVGPGKYELVMITNCKRR